MTNNNELFTLFTILLTSGIAASGFFLRYMINQTNNSIKELKAELHGTNKRIDQISADIASIKPKVNGMWEYFINNKSLK
jgi:hypothetical protein